MTATTQNIKGNYTDKLMQSWSIQSAAIAHLMSHIITAFFIPLTLQHEFLKKTDNFYLESIFLSDMWIKVMTGMVKKTGENPSKEKLFKYCNLQEYNCESGHDAIVELHTTKKK